MKLVTTLQLEDADRELFSDYESVLLEQKVDPHTIESTLTFHRQRLENLANKAFRLGLAEGKAP